VSLKNAFIIFIVIFDFIFCLNIALEIINVSRVSNIVWKTVPDSHHRMSDITCKLSATFTIK